MITT
jgi:hypothetical protein